jgi:hypothetical protein
LLYAAGSLSTVSALLPQPASRNTDEIAKTKVLFFIIE